MLAEGATLRPYRIVAPIGADDLGEVYRGRDARPGSEAAERLIVAANWTAEPRRR